MAYQSMWYTTNLNSKIIDIIEEDVSERYDGNLKLSEVNSSDNLSRSSKVSWIPTSHWLGGFLWHYIQRANRENFGYDLENIDNEHMQYTVYESGDFYKWHKDTCSTQLYKPISVGTSNFIDPKSIQDFANKNCEKMRKLSFSLLLSDPNTYEGGDLQFMDSNRETYFAPKERGTIILFDSRADHRVLKIKSGVRKSIVGWVIGPRFR